MRRRRGEGRARGGGGRGRAHPAHPRRSAPRRAARASPQPGQSRDCAQHLAFQPPPRASARAPHAGDVARPRRAAAFSEHRVFRSDSHCRPPVGFYAARRRWLPWIFFSLFFFFNPTSLARGSLCAHFFPSLIPTCKRPRARPCHPRGLGGDARSSVPSPFLMHVEFPCPWSPLAGWSPVTWLLLWSLALRSEWWRFGGRVGATWGPPVSSRRCAQPLLTTVRHAGQRERLLLLDSPFLGPLISESLGWVYFLLG
jgi:hypothetical protein